MHHLHPKSHPPSVAPPVNGSTSTKRARLKFQKPSWTAFCPTEQSPNPDQLGLERLSYVSPTLLPLPLSWLRPSSAPEPNDHQSYPVPTPHPLISAPIFLPSWSPRRLLISFSCLRFRSSTSWPQAARPAGTLATCISDWPQQIAFHSYLSFPKPRTPSTAQVLSKCWAESEDMVPQDEIWNVLYHTKNVV